MSCNATSDEPFDRFTASRAPRGFVQLSLSHQSLGQLSRGMQGLTIRLAKRLHLLLGTGGGKGVRRALSCAAAGPIRGRFGVGTRTIRLAAASSSQS
jgi:hypothetical protein